MVRLVSGYQNLSDRGRFVAAGTGALVLLSCCCYCILHWRYLFVAWVYSWIFSNFWTGRMWLYSYPYYSGLLSELRSTDPSHIEEVFHVKNIVAFNLCLYYIVLLLEYYPYRFTQMWEHFYFLCTITSVWFPHQCGLRALGFDKFRLLFVYVNVGRYGHDDKLWWC